VPLGRIGLSIYDRYATSTRERATRWSGYGLFRSPGLPDLTLLGEVGFGTDDHGNGVRDNLVAALEAANWKISGPDSAAELLGLKPTTLLSRMTKWGLKRPEREPS